MSKLQILLDLWQDFAGEEGWVHKKDIRLPDLSKIASNLILLKRTEKGQWQFTLIGTKIVEEYKQDLTGVCIDDIPFEECRTLYHEATHHTSEAVQPHRLEGNFCNNDGAYIKAKEVAIPISEDAENVTHVLIACFIDRSNSMRYLYDETGHDTFEYSITPVET